AEHAPPHLVGPGHREVAVRATLLLVPDRALLLEDLQQLEDARVADRVVERLTDLGDRAGAPSPEHAHDVELPVGEMEVVGHDGSPGGAGARATMFFVPSYDVRAALSTTIFVRRHPGRPLAS